MMLKEQLDYFKRVTSTAHVDLIPTQTLRPLITGHGQFQPSNLGSLDSTHAFHALPRSGYVTNQSTFVQSVAPSRNPHGKAPPVVHPVAPIKADQPKSFPYQHGNEDPLVFDQNLTVPIKMEKKGQMYRGLLGNSKKSLLPSPTQMAFEQIAKLKHENVPRLEDVLRFKKEYVVAEHLVTIDEFYSYVFEEFKEENNGKFTVDQWISKIDDMLWSHIRDITFGWFYLNEKGFSCCGHMHTCIYVDANGNSVVMPKVQTKSSTGDFKSFVAVIVSIINKGRGPCATDILLDDAIPEEIKFLVRLSGIPLVNDWWLFSNPSSWDLQKSVNFIFGVDRMLRSEGQFKDKLKDIVGRNLSRDPSWYFSLENDPDLVKIFKEGRARGGYYQEVDFAIFCRNTIVHFRDTKVHLNDAMDKLLEVFPNLIERMYEHICRIGAFAKPSKKKRQTEAEHREEFLVWTSKGSILV